MSEEEAGRVYEWAVHIALSLQNHGDPESVNIMALEVINNRQVFAHAATQTKPGSAE